MNRLARLSIAALTAATMLLAGCERPPVDPVQRGFRGNGIEVVYNPRAVAALAPLNVAPASLDAANPDGPKAKDIYQNVKVLGDLSVGQFSRHMASITQWVSPKEGCNYCHVANNFADDSMYTKVVARRMIQMTQNVNANWKSHVQATGVTCYTCHRGNPVPAQVWFAPEPQDMRGNFIGDRAGQNAPLRSVAYSSLPNDPFTSYLQNALPIRVNGPTALPTGNRSSTKQAEHTYGLMMHFSQSLGVNCTYCHNTRSIGDYSNIMPQQATAWYGIRMVRDLNNAYVTPLTDVFPANRLGPTNDVAKVNCATCHQGVYKPLYGAQMAKNHPELLTVSAVPAANAGAALPPPLAEAMRSVLYFGADSATLQGEQAKGMAQLLVLMAAEPARSVSISGYHSATGTLASNQELAKQRAFSVRDALLAAGIPASRVALDRPMQAAASLTGEDPAARRVEVTVR